MTVECRGRPVGVDFNRPEKAIEVKIPFILRPLLNVHMGANVVQIENRYFAEGQEGSPRVVFYKDSGKTRTTAQPRSVFGRRASFVLYGQGINEDIYCRLLGVKYIPRVDSTGSS